MIVDNELPMHIASPVSQGNARTVRARTWPFAGLGLFVLLLGIVVTLQIVSGAYSAEFSAYPDEPAHYVTSLMLRDYILNFHFQSPIKFAEEYYRHYPKVAFGHWPPLFYILQSFWMMIFSASRASVRLEIAVTSALLGYSVFAELRKDFGWLGGAFASILTVCLPLVQDYSDQEMAEALLTLLCFLSAFYFARYTESGRLRDSVLFGVLFSLAVLTKGSGWLLAMIPPVVLLLTRRLDRLRQGAFWVPVAIVAAICVPWQIMTMRLAEKGWDGGTKPSLAYTLNALPQFLGLFPKILGPAFVLLLLAGLYAMVVRPAVRGAVTAQAASLFALLLSVWVFHSVVPAGVEDRKLVIAVPAMIYFVMAGGRWLANFIPETSAVHRWRFWAVGAAAAAAFLLTTFTVPRIQHYGFIEAARFLTAHPEFHDSTILVSSESGGEGLLISELAMRDPLPSTVVVRATKALASVAWDGKNYQARFHNAAEMRSFLKDEHVNLVVLDTFSPQVHFPHNEMVREALKLGSSCPLVGRFRPTHGRAAGEVQIFRLVN
jgi:hypothetical protein